MMAGEMQAQMMLHEAAKYDQILKNSLPVSIPLPRLSESPRPAERAARPSLDVEWPASPDGGRRAATASRPLCLAPEMPKTAITQHLHDMRVQRTWRRQRAHARDSDTPETGRIHLAEAIMIFERGDERDEAGACGRCRRGEGVSAECVTLRDVPWACSNCIYDQAAGLCDVASSTPLSGGQGGEEEEEEEADFWRETDRIADNRFALSLVAQIRQRVGYGEEESPVERARQVEKAALSVARLARRFREEIQR